MIQKNALVLMSDYSEMDAAVASMKGVAFSVDRSLPVFDLTHNIPKFDIWSGAFCLYQSSRYWPSGTVFIAAVNPTVGKQGLETLAIKTNSNKVYIGPNNGVFSLVVEQEGIAEIRSVNEEFYMLNNANFCHTFMGRDLYTHVGAQLASGVVNYDEIGSNLHPSEMIKINCPDPKINYNKIVGTILTIESNFGNIWTNIFYEQIASELNLTIGDLVNVKLFQNKTLQYDLTIPFVKSFSNVQSSAELLYINSIGTVALAINLNDFAKKYHISLNQDWVIVLKNVLIQ